MSLAEQVWSGVWAVLASLNAPRRWRKWAARRAARATLAQIERERS